MSHLDSKHTPKTRHCNKSERFIYPLALCTTSNKEILIRPTCFAINTYCSLSSYFHFLMFGICVCSSSVVMFHSISTLYVLRHMVIAERNNIHIHLCSRLETMLFRNISVKFTVEISLLKPLTLVHIDICIKC